MYQWKRKEHPLPVVTQGFVVPISKTLLSESEGLGVEENAFGVPA